MQIRIEDFSGFGLLGKPQVIIPRQLSAAIVAAELPLDLRSTPITELAQFADVDGANNIELPH